ncbi:arginine--tRNA ligase [bacterium]|nr:arginine--tRNA ligase [bacterium]
MWPCPASYSAAAEGRAPNKVAARLAAQLSGGERSYEAAALGPFLNFRIKPDVLMESVLDRIYRERERYGTSQVGAGKTVVIDYSSPNIAKPFHVGHLRSTIIGNSIRRLYEALGYRVVGINYLGDWGKQFGLLVYAFRRWGSERKLRENAIGHLVELYIQANREAEADPSIHEEARRIFAGMEAGDEKTLALWRRFRELSIEEARRVYARLGVSFDEYSGESCYQGKMEPVVQDLKKKGLLTVSEGAEVVDLSGDGLGVALIRKRDGATLYLTRDLAAARDRWERYHFDRLFYVVAADQTLHFKQLFRILALLGHEWADHCRHVEFGRVHGMSTRKGEAVFLDDLLNEGKARAFERMRENPEKFAEVDDPEATADVAGISAILFADLCNRRIKNYDFDWDRFLSFEGRTGIYLQNAHARVAGIIRKAGVELVEEVDVGQLSEPEMIELARLLLHYPDQVARAAEACEPSVIANYLLDVAGALHKAYHEDRVKGEARARAQARLRLFWSAQIVLASGMRLLGMTPMEKM